jgi:hypothetical protein
VRLPDPGRLELRPVRDHEQDRQTFDARDEQVEQLARARVRPVRVLHHRQDGPAPRQRLHPPQQGREGALAPALRAEVGQRIPIASGHAEQLRDECEVLWRRIVGCEQRL